MTIANSPTIVPNLVENVDQRAALLAVRDLSVNYGGVQALRNVSIDVYPNEVVTLIGANGAGKTTLLRTISRIVAPKSGTLTYRGLNLLRLRADQVVKAGIAHSPEGRRVLGRQSVEDNLMLGAYIRSDTAGIKADLDRMLTLFPRLAERRAQTAGTLSGGEQQMLAIARALMSKPTLLLLDEPSLGLAPKIVQDVFAAIRRLHADGVTILLVEQNANQALQNADRGYVIEAGEIVLSGTAKTLIQDDRVRQAYLGI